MAKSPPQKSPTPWVVLWFVLLLPVRANVQGVKDDKTDLALRTTHNLVEKINLERTNHGLSPLKVQEDLTRAAVQHTNDMVRFGYFAHSTPNAAEGVEDFGVYAQLQHYLNPTGENLYHGEPKATSILHEWLASAEHRSNILNPLYNEVGVGFSRGRDYSDTYCSTFFGIRPDIYPIVINNEAYSTSENILHLFVYGRGKIKQMRFSSDGKTFGQWEPFRSERDWAVTDGEGVRTVSVELSDGQNTFTSRDSIILTAK